MTPGGPVLPHFEADELADDRRLLGLYDRAVARGVVKRCEASLVRFFAAAERALRKGRNPCRLFAAIVNTGSWDQLCNADDDAAGRRLKRLRGETVRKREDAGTKMDRVWA